MNTDHLIPRIYYDNSFHIKNHFRKIEYEIKNLLYFSLENMNDVKNKRINVAKDNLDEYNIANIIKTYDSFTIYDYITNKHYFINLVNNYFKLRYDYQIACGNKTVKKYNVFDSNNINKKQFYVCLFYTMKKIYNNNFFHKFIQENKDFFDMEYYIPEITSIDDIIDYNFLYEKQNDKNLNIKNILFNFSCNTDINHILKIYEILFYRIKWILFTHDFIDTFNSIKLFNGDNDYIRYKKLYKEILFAMYKHINWKIYDDMKIISDLSVYDEFIDEMDTEKCNYITQNYNENSNYSYHAKTIHLGRGDWDDITYIKNNEYDDNDDRCYYNLNQHN